MKNIDYIEQIENEKQAIRRLKLILRLGCGTIPGLIEQLSRDAENVKYSNLNPEQQQTYKEFIDNDIRILKKLQNEEVQI
jgi:hypothetical protein